MHRSGHRWIFEFRKGEEIRVMLKFWSFRVDIAYKSDCADDRVYNIENSNMIDLQGNTSLPLRRWLNAQREVLGSTGFIGARMMTFSFPSFHPALCW